eukprot:54197-Prorocentrum_lima.AAC.1
MNYCARCGFLEVVRAILQAFSDSGQSRAHSHRGRGIPGKARTSSPRATRGRGRRWRGIGSGD